jgi:hypothetical protein
MFCCSFQGCVSGEDLVNEEVDRLFSLTHSKDLALPGTFPVWFEGLVLSYSYKTVKWESGDEGGVREDPGADTFIVNIEGDMDDVVCCRDPCLQEIHM